MLSLVTRLVLPLGYLEIGRLQIWLLRNLLLGCNQLQLLLHVLMITFKDIIDI